MFEDRTFSFKNILLVATVVLFICFIIYIASNINPRTKIVFCDVGQGDGAYMRTKSGIDIVIDSGPSRAILDCLGKHMPFYDRTIELAFITHPQKDHYGGFEYVLERYKIQKIIMPPVDSDADSFQSILRKIHTKKLTLKHLYRGSRIILSKESMIEYLWPTRDFVTNSLGSNADIAKSGLYKTSEDPNIFSQVFIYDEGDFEVLFTGDMTPEISDIVAKDALLLKARQLGSDNNKTTFSVKSEKKSKYILDSSNSIEVLKVPHHGSKNGLSNNLLQLAEPAVSVISAGVKNRYGHPHKQVLNLLKSHKIPYIQTGLEGDITVELYGN